MYLCTYTHTHTHTHTHPTFICICIYVEGLSLKRDTPIYLFINMQRQYFIKHMLLYELHGMYSSISTHVFPRTYEKPWIDTIRIYVKCMFNI